MPRRDKSPAFQWYPRDYMADALVQSMSLEQEGAYRRLLDHCWLENGLPTDIEELWRLAKAPNRDVFEKRIWPLVSRKFTTRNKKLHNRRLLRERSKQATWRDRAATGGDAKAARAKRLKAAREKGTHTEYEWAQILIACGGACARCGSMENIVKDHIKPIYQGGSDSAENLQPLCFGCNASKGPDCTDFRDSAKQRLSKQQAEKNSALLSSSSSSSASLSADEDKNKPTGADAPGFPQVVHRQLKSKPDWFEECKKEHNGICGGRHAHIQAMRHGLLPCQQRALAEQES